MSTNFSKLYFIDLTTISNADPAVFGLADHGLNPGDTIRLETTDTLPTGLVLLTNYYVVYNGLATDEFQISAQRHGTPIVTTSAGSGTHSYRKMNRANLMPRQENDR